MSGGHFDYQSTKLGWFAQEIRDDAVLNSEDRMDGQWLRKAEPPDILEAMNYCADELERIGKLAKALEWYLSSDWGPEQVAEAYAAAKGMPTDQQIIDLAQATQTAEGGTDGYVLPISFARELLNAYVNRKT